MKTILPQVVLIVLVSMGAVHAGDEGFYLSQVTSDANAERVRVTNELKRQLSRLNSPHLRELPPGEKVRIKRQIGQMLPPIGSKASEDEGARIAELTAMLDDDAVARMDPNVRAENIQIIEALLDRGHSTDECRDMVINRIRQAYAKDASSVGGMLDASWFANALFWIRGTADGLMEFEKLAGPSTPSAITFLHVDMAGDPSMGQALLMYEVGRRMTIETRNELEYVQSGRWRSWGNELPWLRSIEIRYRGNSTLSAFLKRYPFCGYSYIPKAPEVAFSGYYGPEGQAKLLYEYCMGLESVKSDRMGFIRNVSTHYGQDELVRLLDMMTADPNLAKNDAAFYNDVFVFAVENGLWDTVRGLLRFAGEDGNGLSPAAAAVMRKAVKAEREKLDAIQSIVDSWRKPSSVPADTGANTGTKAN